MKKTVILLSGIIITSLFMGCGSSDKDKNKDESTLNSNNTTNENSNNNTNGNSVGSLRSKAQRVKSAQTGLTFRNRSNSNSASKMQYKTSKIEKGSNGVVPCKVSGTLQTEEEGTEISTKYNLCVYPYKGKYVLEDGSVYSIFRDDITLIQYQKYSYIPDYENRPETGEYYTELLMGLSTTREASQFYVDGELFIIEQDSVVEHTSYKKLHYKENLSNNSWHIKGSFFDEFKCFSEDYTYETSDTDWLVPHPTKKDYYTSGTIEINGMKYVYKGDNVTLSQDGERETFTQKEILEYADEITSEDSCSDSNELTKK
jgi:hypothetical protein